jgi:hypothetical protein
LYAAKVAVGYEGVAAISHRIRIAAGMIYRNFGEYLRERVVRENCRGLAGC